MLSFLFALFPTRSASPSAAGGFQRRSDGAGKQGETFRAGSEGPRGHVEKERGLEKGFGTGERREKGGKNKKTRDCRSLYVSDINGISFFFFFEGSKVNFAI